MTKTVLVSLFITWLLIIYFLYTEWKFLDKLSRERAAYYDISHEEWCKNYRFSVCLDKMHRGGIINRIKRYYKPYRLTLESNPPIYLWLWFVIADKPLVKDK